MKYLSFFFLFSLTFSCKQESKVELSQLVSGAESTREFDDYIYQYSMIDALLAGVYDGHLTFRELKRRGDTGIGTFNQVNGEMILLDNQIYRIKSDGKIDRVEDTARTPLAFVKFFQPDTSFLIEKKQMDYAYFENEIKKRLNPNELYVLKIKGNFESIHARAPEPAQKPYRPLTEHLSEHQKEFDLRNTTGQAIGFFLPEYTIRMNVPGFHFHYISDDFETGGHVLNFIADEVEVEVDRATGLIMENLNSEEFRAADLLKDRQRETEKVERGR